MKKWYEKNREWVIKIGIVLLMSFVTAYLLEVVSLTIREWPFLKSLLGACYYVLLQPIQWLSIILFGTFYMLLLSLLNKLYSTVVVSSIIFTPIVVSLIYKLKLRGEAIVYSDVHELKSIDSLVSIDLKTLVMLSAGLCLFVVGMVFLSWKIKSRSKNTASILTASFFRNVRLRVTVAVISLLILLCPVLIPQSRMSSFYDALGREHLDYSTAEDAVRNGALMAFLNTLNRQLIQKPEGYSRNHMDYLTKKYSSVAELINNGRRSSNLDGQTVIYILSESLSNPEDVPGLLTDKPVVANINRLKSESTVSGKMISSGFGGGTANVEYMTLTGLPLTMYASNVTTPYVQLTGSAKAMPTILDYFDNKSTIHPYIGTFYNRKNFYKSVGMDSFVTTDGVGNQKIQNSSKMKGSEYIRDSSAYKELMDRINSSDKESQFLQLITMQNHMPYTSDENFKESEKVTVVSSHEKKTLSQMNSYLSNVRETDVQTGLLAGKIEKMDRPVTIVFYGDHWLASVYPVVKGVSQVATHTTDYFIWQNKAARKLNTAKIKAKPYVAPSEFNSLMLNSTGTKLSPYFALQDKISSNIPAIANYTRDNNGNLMFVNSDGEEIKEASLNTKQQEYLTDMRHVMYDLAEGEGYLLETAFFDVEK